MTEKDRRRYHLALEQAQGDREIAADIVKIPLAELVDLIGRDPSLRARWSNPNSTELVNEPPDEIDSLGKKNSITALPPVTEEDIRISKVIVDEDRLLRAGLTKLHLTPREQELAYNLQEFHNQQFVPSVNMVGGSVTRVSMILQTQIDEINARLLMVRAKIRAEGITPEDRDRCVDEERLLMGYLIDISTELRNTFAIAQNGMLTTAMVHERLRKKKDERPRFQSIPHAEASNG